jgi:hypothetical protein
MEKRLTFRGSPSPPESWSRREPPPGLGSAKSTPSMKAASGAGCLCTRGSSAAWRPNSDAKGIYIKGKEPWTRPGGGESRGVMGAKGAITSQVEACFIHSPGSIHASARGVMGCFSLAG